MRKSQYSYIVSLIILLLAAIGSVGIGAVSIPIDEILNMLIGSGVDNSTALTTILFEIRLPHTMLMLLTGAALGGSGAAYQGLFRNPLADPYLIGAASGAGLGAVLVMSVNFPNTASDFLSVPLGAFLGAIIAILIVYLLAYNKGTAPTTNLILAGVAVGSFATALTSYLMLQSQGELRRTIAWLLGGSTIGGWQPVVASLPYILIGLVTLIFSGHMLNVLQFGERQAEQLGLSVGRTKFILIFSATLVTATAVSFAGIIGFIGLIIPHIVRMIRGSDYRHLIPLSIIGGASSLLVADAFARIILAPQTLPVGVITALLGAPFFLWILRRSKSRGFQ